MKKIIAKIILVVVLFARLTVHAEVPQLPEDWYTNPEDYQDGSEASFLPTLPWTKKGKMERLVKSIYEVNLTALENSANIKSSPAPVKNMPNWTPWHLEAFTTELAVVGSGLIGVLTGKGTAAALAYWRKQDTAASKQRNSFIETEESSSSSIPTLNIENIDSAVALKAEIEPMVRAALASGKIQDEKTFRQNAETAAFEFFGLVNGIKDDPSSRWWVSGLRIEFNVSASGTLIPSAPVVSVGGDVRMRFDWRRLSRSQPRRLLKESTSNYSGALGFVGSRSKVQGGLQELVYSLAEDLSSTFDEDFKTKGFKPYAFRFGLGFSASGNVGVAKSSASAIAAISFAADVKDPAQKFLSGSHSAPILLIEKNPSERHLQFAFDKHIPVSIEDKKIRAVYTVNRANFKKGLRKAVKMANFFVSAGKKVNSKKWKLHQMKIGFDFSITGDVGLVKYSGLSSAEMAFYNLKF